MTAVWDVRGLASASHRLVLLKLADCANDQGRSSYPSVKTIATDCDISVRSVQRCLRDLETAGYIAVDKPATSRFPTVWRLHLLGCQSDTPQHLGVTSETTRGDVPVTSGVTRVSPDPSVDPSQDPSVRTGNAHTIKALLSEHEKLFRAEVGTKPHYSGKDAAHAKRLIQQHGYDAVVAMLPRLFDSHDRFIQQSGKDMAILASCWNKLAAQQKPQNADDLRRQTEARNRKHVLSAPPPQILMEDE
jgi:hypothetical protein